MSPRRMPKADEALLRRFREGDSRIPAQEIRDLVAKSGGDFRLSQILGAALTSGERPERRKAVWALISVVEELAAGREAREIDIPTERRLQEWAAQAEAEEADDTP